jgi:hypothetical protein
VKAALTISCPAVSLVLILPCDNQDVLSLCAAAWFADRRNSIGKQAAWCQAGLARGQAAINGGKEHIRIACQFRLALKLSMHFHQGLNTR